MTIVHQLCNLFTHLLCAVASSFLYFVLSLLDEVAEQADQKGASDNILAAISRNRDNTELLDSACRALGSLAMNRKTKM